MRGKRTVNQNRRRLNRCEWSELLVLAVNANYWLQIGCGSIRHWCDITGTAKAVMKLNIQAPITKCIAPLSQATLWQCETCNSFVGIQSQHPVMEPLCPVCGSPTMEMCSPMPSILGCEWADA